MMILMKLGTSTRSGAECQAEGGSQVQRLVAHLYPHIRFPRRVARLFLSAYFQRVPPRGTNAGPLTKVQVAEATQSPQELQVLQVVQKLEMFQSIQPVQVP